jgi:hypothetical protein
MDWIGLDWNGLDWNGLDWNGLAWIYIYYSRLPIAVHNFMTTQANALMIMRVAPEGCQGVCNEGSRKTLARMFPDPHYRTCSSGAGLQQGGRHSETQMEAHGAQQDLKWTSDQWLEAAI